MSINLNPTRHLTAFGPIVDDIVVPYEPRTSMEAAAYGTTSSSMFNGNKPTNSPGGGGGGGMLHLPVTAFAGDILFGVTRVEVPDDVFSTNDEQNGIDVGRRNRVLRTLVRNLFDYHQKV